MNWFYEQNGAQQGPVSDGELDRLVAQGIVKPTTLIWREGMPNWTPLSQARPGGPVEASPAAAGTVQCDSCGRYFDPSDVVQIGPRRICASCKPAVLQGLQQGGLLPEVEDPRRTGPAWEHREALGWFPAARDTAKAVLAQPSETFETMRRTGGLMNPFWYYVLTAGIGQVMLSIYMGSIELVAGNMGGTFGGQQLAVPTMGGFAVFMLLMRIVWTAVGVAMAAFVQSAIIHVCLMICGGARRPYEATFRAICYGAGSVALLNVIPGIGTLIAIPWSLVVNCIALAKTHETDLWRAVVAIFLPMIVCCGLAGILLMAILGAVSASHGIR